MKKYILLAVTISLLNFSFGQQIDQDTIMVEDDQAGVSYEDNTLQSTPFTVELRGSLRGLGKIFIESPAAVDLLESRLKLELLSTLGQKTAFRALGHVVYTYPAGKINFDLKEAYLDYYTRYIDFRFGQQVNAWGKADELNPTDVLNPQDMNNLTEDKNIRKIGLFQARADVKLYGFVLIGIWKPVFEYFRIPPLDSRWAFFSIPGVTELPAPTYPDAELKNTEWAVKLSRTISSVDFSLSYFDGWENIYSPVVVMDTSTHQLSVSQLITHRSQMIGADFATSIASVGFWGEGAYFLTEDIEGDDPSIKNPYIQFVIGADYEFNHKFKLNVQYFQEVVTKTDDDDEKTQEEAINSKLGIGLPLQQALTLRLEKRFGQAEEFKAEIFGIYDLKYNGVMLIPKFFYSPEDGFNIEVGYILYDGKDESFWSRFDHNDEIYLKCTYSF